MTEEQTKRLKSVLLRWGIILSVGIVYLIWVLLTDIRIPCIFYELTGLSCPGCGITRMFSSLALLDFSSAFAYNGFMLVSLPFVAGLIAFLEIRYVTRGKTSPKLFLPVAVLWAVGAVAFAAVRNFI